MIQIFTENELTEEEKLDFRNGTELSETRMFTWNINENIFYIKSKDVSINFFYDFMFKISEEATPKVEIDNIEVIDPMQVSILDEIEKKEKTSAKKEKDFNDFSFEVQECMSEVCKYFPSDMTPSTPKQEIKWLECIDRLNRIDKLGFQDIVLLVKIARNDDFWSNNFLSLLKLRQKDKQGVLYWKVFREKFKQKPTNAQNTIDAVQEALRNVKD